MWTLVFCGALAFAASNEADKTAINPDAEPAAESTEKAADDYAPEKESGQKPYVFGWLDYPEPTLKLRGGTTKGDPVTLATEASEQWNALQQADLSPLERDRRAILALAGQYRVSFDFLEVELYQTGTQPTAPYRSWTTEWVNVLEDSESQISLQHIMVMFFEDPKGEHHGPMVMKHWRQDWVYEPETALEFIGDSQWETRTLSEAERKGQWQQTVYQVDDSPRYAMRGTWTHTKNHSAWDGANSWRPLPRREFSIRSDYQTLVGTNRITVTPMGWVHTQDNMKTVLKGPREIDAENPVLAREFGINRYDHIVGFDFSAGETYWEKTAEYWARVRDGWTGQLNSAPTVRVEKTCEEVRLYASLFDMAQKIATDKKVKLKAQEKHISKILGCAVSVGQAEK